jgi:hypothetical protein
MKAACLALSLCCLGFLAALGLASPSPGDAGGSPPSEVDKLIRQLGDKQYAVREAATRRLLELEEASPALRAALKSSDQEVARRAASILEEFRCRSGPRALARLKEHAEKGEVDQAVELFVGRSKWEDEKACWQVLTGLAAKLIERGKQEFGTAVPPLIDQLPAGDFGRFLKVVNPPFLVGSRVRPYAIRKGNGAGFVLRGKDIWIESGHDDYGLVACAGGLRVGRKLLTSHLTKSVIYATGPVEMQGVIRSLLVCDGDLKVGDIGSSLVIVRGDVHCTNSGSVGNSLVIMSGRRHPAKYETIAKTAKILEGQRDLLGFVKFFDPVREGIEVEAAKGGARVKAVDTGKAFAKAGLRAGDVITSLEGEASADPETFRRQLRSALARDEGLILQVSRGGQSRQILIPPAQP